MQINFLKPCFFFHSSNLCDLLSNNSSQIAKTYSIAKKIFFQEALGGIVNPPVMVFSAENKKNPIGVIKATEKRNEAITAIRLRILDNLKKEGFIHFPKIFRNSKGEYLTKIADVPVYLMQFLSPDHLPISFDKFLTVTGDFHRYAKKIPAIDHLQSNKLDEYRLRSKIFTDSWFQEFDQMFMDSSWKSIVELSIYFSSEDFRNVYQRLPSQLIHGDNNQTNIIVSNKIPYFIDFDSLRFDIRLLDIASYFRYGGFDQYLSLSEENKIFPYLSATYGTLSPSEERCFHWIVAFSHIEFMSWAMKMLKKSYMKLNYEKTKEFYDYIVIYKNQLNQILKFDDLKLMPVFEK